MKHPVYDKSMIYAVSIYQYAETHFILNCGNKNTFLETFTTGPYLTFFCLFILLASLMQNSAFLQCSARYQSSPHIAITLPPGLPPYKHNTDQIKFLNSNLQQCKQLSTELLNTHNSHNNYNLSELHKTRWADSDIHNINCNLILKKYNHTTRRQPHISHCTPLCAEYSKTCLQSKMF